MVYFYTIEGSIIKKVWFNSTILIFSDQPQQQFQQMPQQQFQQIPQQQFQQMPQQQFQQMPQYQFQQMPQIQFQQMPQQPQQQLRHTHQQQSHLIPQYSSQVYQMSQNSFNFNHNNLNQQFDFANNPWFTQHQQQPSYLGEHFLPQQMMPFNTAQLNNLAMQPVNNSSMQQSFNNLQGQNQFPTQSYPYYQGSGF
jgi:hypothetical protein